MNDDQETGDGANDADATAASMKADFSPLARSVSTWTMEDRRRNAVRSKGGIITKYVSFAQSLISDSPGPLVFLARDALPLKALVDHIGTRDGKSIETREFALTRLMLPQSIQNLTGDFAARQAAIRSHVAKTTKDQTPVHRFIAQELGDHKPATLVDTGFWGTCASYACVYLEMALGVQVGWRLLFGPEGSPAAIVDYTEENLTCLVEHLFSFPYTYTGDLSNAGDKLVPETERSRFEADADNRYLWEIDELLKIADEMR